MRIATRGKGDARWPLCKGRGMKKGLKTGGKEKWWWVKSAGRDSRLVEMWKWERVKER